MPDAAPIPTPAAERQRRHRARRKGGRFVVPVELAEKHLDMLTVGGWLGPNDAEDVRSCGLAVARVLDVLSKEVSHVTPKPSELD